MELKGKNLSRIPPGVDFKESLMTHFSLDMYPHMGYKLSHEI